MKDTSKDKTILIKEKNHERLIRFSYSGWSGRLIIETSCKDISDGQRNFLNIFLEFDQIEKLKEFLNE